MPHFELIPYKAAASWSALPSHIRDLGLEETANSEKFPGMVLPALGETGVCWYALAFSQQDWRKLNPILVSYVGYTISKYKGEPSDLDQSIPVENYLTGLSPYAIAKIVVPASKLKFAARALDRMKNTLLARPRDLRPPPLSTAHMLSRFDMCVVEGDRPGATAWINRLRDESRLDATNLSFLEVKLLASFREWDAILSSPMFKEIARVRKPQAIAHYLLEAIWNGRLGSFAADPSALRQHFDSHWSIVTKSILLSCGGVPSEWIAGTFENLLPLTIQTMEETPQQSESSEQAQQPTDPISSTESVPEFVPSTIVDTWFDWVEALKKPSFAYRETAECLALTLKGGTLNPDGVRDLEEALYDLEDSQALTRLIDAVPYFMEWLKSDEGFPRRQMKPLYEVVLLRLVESRNRESEFREGITDLLAALLEIGLGADEYRAILDDITKAIPSGAGISDVFWLLDLAVVLCNFSAEDESERKAILNKILACMTPILRQLTPIQKSACMNVASAAGWGDLQIAESSSHTAETGDVLADCYIGIYTLTESAGRQAEQVLKQLYPDIRVEVSNDMVATSRLKKMAQNADIFVVTASSAKHAATDCIRDNRPAERIVYASGKGFGSIMRAIEENAFDQRNSEC